MKGKFSWDSLRIVVRCEAEMNDRLTTDRSRHLFTPRCVECGYDGAMLHGGAAERCTRCGCDLLERPARSYAEMEGLISAPATLTGHMERIGGAAQERAVSNLVERWLWFAFLALLLIFAIAALAVNAVEAAG